VGYYGNRGVMEKGEGGSYLCGYVCRMKSNILITRYVGLSLIRLSEMAFPCLPIIEMLYSP
jgi:hypothetical protein